MGSDGSTTSGWTSWIPTIASGIGSVWNYLSGNKTNKDSREFATSMYDRQRSDAIADRAHAEDYNSPAATMDRYKAAGLNPNLIYGQQPITSPAVRSSSPGSYSPVAPKVDTAGISQGIFQSQDLRLKEAQTDNIRAQTGVANQQAKLLEAQRNNAEADYAEKNIGIAAGNFNLWKAKELFPPTLEGAELANKKTSSDIALAFRADERQAIAASQSLRESVERIASMRAANSKVPYEIDNLKALTANSQIKNLLDQFEVELNKNGVSKHDPLWQRTISRIVDKIKGANVKDAMESIRSEISDWINNPLGNKGRGASGQW